MLREAVVFWLKTWRQCWFVSAFLFLVAVTSSPAASSSTPGTLRWKFTPPSLGTWSGASIGPNGTVYVSLCQQDGGGVMYALDGTSGDIKWQFQSTCFNSTPAVGDNGAVYFGGKDHVMYALDAIDGTVLWTNSVGPGFGASPAIGASGTIYIGCNDSNLYAFSATSGEKLWQFTTGGQIHETPAVGMDGTVYTGCMDGKLYALDGVTGAKKWAFVTAGAIFCSPAISDDGTVYFGSADHSVYAVNGTTGKQRWKFTTDAAVDWSPAIADEMVVIGSSDGVMYSLDVDTGATCWSLPFSVRFSRGHPIFGTDGNLYFGGPGWLGALDHVTKLGAWVYYTPTTNNFTATIGPDGTIYFGSDGGAFYAIWSTSLGGLGQSPWPGSGQNVRRTSAVQTGPRILNQPASQVVQIGDAATLTAIAVGMPPLKVQWMLNDSPIANAVNMGLVLTNLQPSKFGAYRLVISNRFGSVTSDAATIGSNSLPTITLQPQDATVAAGGSVKFNVAASSLSPLGYQWQLNASNLLGATYPELALTNVNLADTGLYRALVSNTSGTVFSSNAKLLVVMPAALGMATNGQLSLDGTVGGRYRLETTPDLLAAPWVSLTNLMLLSNSVSISTSAFTNSGRAFYRAVTTQ